MMLSPLEQFEIVVLQPIRIAGLDISVTNAGLYSAFILLVVSLFFYVAVSRPFFVPTRWQSVAETFYLFILDMIKQQAGVRAYSAFPLLFATFFAILVSNLLGLTPFGFTVTSHILITFALAFCFNLGFVFLGLYMHKLRFFSLFVPKGVPAVLLPLIVVIELVSYFIRTFSLSLRLFANMMAGHTLLNILSSFVTAFLAIGGITAVFAVVPFLLVFAVTLLEVGIAFLQAYVFTILLCIYMNDSLNLH